MNTPQEAKYTYEFSLVNTSKQQMLKRGRDWTRGGEERGKMQEM